MVGNPHYFDDDIEALCAEREACKTTVAMPAPAIHGSIQAHSGREYILILVSGTRLCF